MAVGGRPANSLKGHLPLERSPTSPEDAPSGSRPANILEPMTVDITQPAQMKGSPIVILVEPQMAENIGTTARAMANFGLTRMRLVSPRDGWPNARAYPAASGANRILDEAELFGSLEEAIADLSFTYAATARPHDQVKPVVGPREAVGALVPKVAAGEAVGVVFGRERNGLLAGEVALANAILTYPVNPAFSSLNLAQAVLVLGYEWFSQAHGAALPHVAEERSEPANKAQMLALFETLERELDRVEFFRPPEKREGMVINLRNILQRMQPTRQDVATLHGVITSISEGAKGPARGGTFTAEGAEALRNFLADSTKGLTGGTAPVRGISRLIRRNPTEAERALWDVMTKDRRFAGRGFKRAVPIGPHVADLVSFPLRVVVDFEPHTQGDEAAERRTEKRRWLAERGYRIIVMEARTVEADPPAALDLLEQELATG
jgi:tRNA/rRNA methyltransferase